MIHLHYGVSIKSSAWREIKSIESSSTPSKFVGNAALAIWNGPDNIIARSLDPNACKKHRIPGIKVKQFSPHKLACLKRRLF